MNVCKNEACEYSVKTQLPQKLYRPSNGTEGMIFEERFCDQCRHEDVEKDRYCEIHNNALMFEFDDTAGYPWQWRKGDDGYPYCAAFEHPPQPGELTPIKDVDGQAKIFDSA